MTRWKAGLAAAVVAIGAGIAVGAASVGAKTRAAGQHTNGIDHLSITHSAGGFEYAAGNNWDKLLGTGASRFKLRITGGPGGPKLVSNHVVFYTGKGSLIGTGSADVSISGSTETFTHGQAHLTRGTGGEKGHSLVVTFSGSGNSSNNQYVFNYSGTYK